jgi:hypothetical protein
LYGLPLVWAPARLIEVSPFRVWEEDLLECALVLPLFFSMKTAIGTERSISNALNRARLSAVIFPSVHCCAQWRLRASNSSRRDCP